MSNMSNGVLSTSFEMEKILEMRSSSSFHATHGILGDQLAANPSHI